MVLLLLTRWTAVMVGLHPVDKESQAPVQRETAAILLTLPTLPVAGCLQSAVTVCRLETPGYCAGYDSTREGQSTVPVMWGELPEW